MSVNRVTVKLKGVTSDQEIISLPETMKLKGCYLESAVFMSYDGTVDVLVTNTLNKDLMLKPGTQIGSFQVCEKPIKIVNESEDDSECEKTFVCPVQSDTEDLEWKFRNHLRSTCQHSLQKELLNLLVKHKDAIALPGDALGKTDILKHKIKLKEGTQPIYIPAYRMPHSKLATLDKIIAEMLAQDVIEPTDSEWNFPLILVPKSDGSLRPVVDYRKLNEHTIPDRLPLPVISDILHSLGTDNKYFSTIDIKSAFWQIELEEGSKDMTAFSTPTGHYRFKRMPFGLCNSPLTYMRLMNQVLTGLLGNTANVFLDDILIASKTAEEHFVKLDLVLSRLRAAGLKVKLEKCSFLQEKVVYLGHQIGQHGLKTLQSKVDAVKMFPIPTSVDKVRSFLGLTGYYRKFVKDYAHIAHPLSSLLKKNAIFTWGLEQQQAFDNLKERLTTAPVLIFPNYQQEFILCTDASDIGLGGILMQERNGRPQPIAYASRLCTSAEKNYSITERETLAVIYSLEKFRDIILGYKIRVWTDHTTIQNLFKHKNLRGRIARWFTTLQSYDVSFEYIPGKKNVAADALSRNIGEVNSIVCNIQELLTLDMDVVKAEQRKDNTWSTVIDYLRNPEEAPTPKLPKKLRLDEFELTDDILNRNTALSDIESSRGKVRQLVIPHSLTQTVLKHLHDTPTSAHPGKDKTYKQAKLKYFWTHMRKTIFDYVDQCLICAETKGNTGAPAPLLSYPIPDRPWGRVHLDTLELPLSESGYKYLLVAIDYLSRYCILQPIPNKKAETVASAIFEQIICNFTTPHTIISDNGTEFNNEILNELCRLFNIKKINVQIYKPQANGVVERLNRKVITCLRSLINPHSITWDTWIPYVKCALNSQINSATGETPHYIIFGEDKTLPYELLNSNPRPVYNEDDYIKNRVNQFQVIYQRVKNHMSKYSEQMREQQHKTAQQIKLKEGDIVMAKLHVPVANSNKLSPKYTGPYKVLSAASGNKFQLKHLHDGEVVIRHFNDLKMASGLNSSTNSSNNDNKMFENPPENLVNRDNDVQDSDNENSTNVTNEQNDNVNEYRKKLRNYVKNVNFISDSADEWERIVTNEHISNIINSKEFEEEEKLIDAEKEIIETKFYMYVNEMLSELGVDCDSFYR